MSDRRRSVAWTATAIVAVVLGLAGSWVSVGISHLPAGLFHLVCGWSLTVAGLAAWRMAPASRVGPLLAVAGIGVFLGDASGCLDITPLSRRCLDVPALAAASESLALIWTGFLAHALLTFPTGRIDGRATGAVVVVGYLVALALPALGAGAEVLAVLALAAWLGIRWLRSSPRARSDRLPAVLGGAVLALVVTAADLADRVRVTLIADDPAWTLVLAGLRNVTGLKALPFGAALVGIGLAAALMERAVAARHATDRIVELGIRPSGASGDLVAALLDAPPADVPGLAGDPALQEAAGRATALLRANEQLRDEAQQQLDALTESRRRLLDAAVEERAGLERRLHDGAGRTLDALALTLADAAAVAASPRPATPRPLAADPELAGRLAHARDQLALTREEVADLARGLHPRVLDDIGLVAAVRDLCGRLPVPTSLDADDPIPLEPVARVTAWFVVGEGAANAVKHARATHVSIRLHRTPDGGATIAIEDDGDGGATERPGGGLAGLRDRLEALGGGLTLRSAPGQGTSLAATIPGSEARPA